MAYTLQAGSAGYEQMKANTNSFEQARRIPMFKVKDLYPSVMHENSTNFSCVILPAFDSSMNPLDAAFKDSVMPYRDKNYKTETGAYAFSGWFVSVQGYKFYGKGMSTFISPRTVGAPDPIYELTTYVRNAMRSGDKTYAYLVERYAPKSGKFTALMNPGMMHLVNIWGNNTNVRAKDQSTKNRVLLLATTAFTKLVSDLDSYGTTDDADPNWPNYLYGDPTDPDRAIICTPSSYSTVASGSNRQISCQVLNLGTVTPQGQILHLATQRTKVTPEMLRGRYNLTDTENVLHIPSYDEIVELLVEEELVPYELVEKVCSGKCQNFPVRAKRASFAAPAPQPQFTPQQQPAPFAPAASAPTTQAPYATLTPTPVHPASMNAGFPDNPQDELPGLESAPVATGRTQAEEAELATLRGKIESNQASKDDFVRYTELMKKTPFRQ